jgi:hypothetical protein
MTSRLQPFPYPVPARVAVRGGAEHRKTGVWLRHDSEPRTLSAWNNSMNDGPCRNGIQIEDPHKAPIPAHMVDREKGHAGMLSRN